MQRLVRFLDAQIAAQSLRWRLWAPVAFGAGCAVYFAWPTEPPPWPLLLTALCSIGLWQGLRHTGRARWVTWPCMVLCFLASGLATAKVRSDLRAAPIAPALAEPTVIEGWVVDLDSPGSAGPRVLIAPVRIRGLAPEDTPVRVRATLRDGVLPRPGTPVRVYAVLNPPPAPASPGAYDFGRGAWFQRLGGVAFSIGQTRLADLEPAPWRLRQVMRINAFRADLAQRIVHRIGARTGGIAAAMTTGVEAWLQPTDMDTMRNSGLAHILSISGLHMAVVGGFVFFLVRLLIAAWPWLALRVSSKKVAAWAGLLALAVYLVVSGAPPPAERAAITAGIAFVAILLDRRAITMHALAVAALVVMIMQPEAVVTPGFQMSFAATAALVALAETVRRPPKEISVPWPILIVQRTGQWLMAAVLVSLVAGLATGPFAMQHFNRTAVYGLFANLATAALADFLIMPTLALGAVAETFGAGGPLLWLAGQGIGIMLRVGEWTAGLPGAVRVVASAPTVALPIAFFGILFICLWRGPLRWLGLPLACAVLLWPRPQPPDIWIGDGGTQAAVRHDATAWTARPRVKAFAADVWSRRWGLTVTEAPPAAWSCKRFSCTPTGPSPRIAIWWGRRTPSEADLTELCLKAEVVSVRSDLPALPPSCARRLVLDGTDFAKGGAVELWRDGTQWRGRWTSQIRGQRPWSRYGDADGDPDLTGS